MKPSIGRIVHYKLSPDDVRRINDNRMKLGSVGRNRASVDEVYPAIIVCVWPDEHGPGIPGINGQAFLDGDDTHWILSAKEGTEGGQWQWPPRVE